MVVETKNKFKDQKDKCGKCVLMKPNLMHQLGCRYQITDKLNKRWWENIKEMTEKDTNGSLQLIGKRIHKDNPQISTD